MMIVLSVLEGYIRIYFFYKNRMLFWIVYESLLYDKNDRFLENIKLFIL